MNTKEEVKPGINDLDFDQLYAFALELQWVGEGVRSRAYEADGGGTSHALAVVSEALERAHDALFDVANKAGNYLEHGPADRATDRNWSDRKYLSLADRRRITERALERIDAEIARAGEELVSD